MRSGCCRLPRTRNQDSSECLFSWEAINPAGEGIGPYLTKGQMGCGRIDLCCECCAQCLQESRTELCSFCLLSWSVKTLCLANLSCIWTWISYLLSPSLSFLPDMTWLATGHGDPIQCCCLLAPDHPAPQQCSSPDAASAEDQWLVKGNWVSPAHTGQCQLLPQHVSLLHQSCCHVSLLSRHQRPDREQQELTVPVVWDMRETPGTGGPSGSNPTAAEPGKQDRPWDGGQI